MELHNAFCDIQITVDPTYTVASADNWHYDFEYNPNQYKHSDRYKVLRIHIDLFDTELTIAQREITCHVQRHFLYVDSRDNSVDNGIFIHAIVSRHVETVVLITQGEAAI